MSRVGCIYQFANPITNENSTYLCILLLNNKLQAVMPYSSDFYTFTLLRQWKGGTSFQKSVRALKYLKRKVPYFISDKNLTNGYVNKTWKYVYFELKYFECIHYYFLFLILSSLPTSTGGRGGGGWNWWQWTVTQNVWCEISLHCARKEELSIE